MLSVNNIFEGTSTIHRDRSDKLNALTGSTAFSIAKKNKDPLYLKYKHFNDLRLSLKEKILAKYSSKAKSIARSKLK